MAKQGNAPETPSPAPPDHNKPAPLTADERADLFIIHMRNHRGLDKELAAAQEIVRGINKRRKRLRNDMRSDGFKLEYVDEILRDEGKSRSDNESDAANRTFMRRVQKLPVTGNSDDDQLDLFTAKTSKGDVSLDKDDAYWAGIAYAIALRGGDVSAQENNVPPERIQAWEQGLAAAYTQITNSENTVKAIEERRQ